MIFLKKLFIYIGLLYVLLLVFLIFMQRAFIYFPTEKAPKFSDYGQAAKGYVPIETITEDKKRLRGWYHKANDPEKPLFIWFHGNGADYSSRVYWANHYAEKGYGVLLAGYRGYGGNEGKPTELGLYMDGASWIKTASEFLGKSGDDIILYGESLGTGVAIEMATRYEAKALILQTPYTSLRAIAQRKYPIYPIGIVMKDQYDSLSRIGRIKMPIFMFHGTDDEVIPLYFAQELFQAAPEPKSFKIIHGGRHADLYNHNAEDYVLRFLNKLQ